VGVRKPVYTVNVEEHDRIGVLIGAKRNRRWIDAEAARGFALGANALHQVSVPCCVNRETRGCHPRSVEA